MAAVPVAGVHQGASCVRELQRPHLVCRSRGPRKGGCCQPRMRLHAIVMPIMGCEGEEDNALPLTGRDLGHEQPYGMMRACNVVRPDGRTDGVARRGP